MLPFLLNIHSQKYNFLSPHLVTFSLTKLKLMAEIKRKFNMENIYIINKNVA